MNRNTGNTGEDAVFGNEALNAFRPDIVYVHTSNRNISAWPSVTDTPEMIEELLEHQYEHFRSMWEKSEKTGVVLLFKNNMEYPFYRLLGNQVV